jgi:hypothetical protein
MPPDVDRAMELLRELAVEITAAAREKPQFPVPAPNATVSAESPMAEEFAQARAGLQAARREFERLYALTRDDPVEDRERRRGTIQLELARLNESEARLDAAERRLVASLHGRS